MVLVGFSFSFSFSLPSLLPFYDDGAMPLEVMACIHIPRHRHIRILWSFPFGLASALRNGQHLHSIATCVDLPWLEVVHSLTAFPNTSFRFYLVFLTKPFASALFLGNATLRQYTDSRGHSRPMSPSFSFLTAKWWNLPVHP